MAGYINKEILDAAGVLRKELHRHPELSGEEKKTASRIKNFLSKQSPDEIITGIGGHGLAAVFDSKDGGPAVLFRADLDALPIEEVNSFDHRSKTEGVSHKCGHDGHMAILAGVSMVLKKKRPQSGKIILLFQPEEETGQGAEKVIKDEKYSGIKPDLAFACHNLPGFERNSIIIKEGPFASASKGMIIDLKGRSSHAAHPEQGNSPVTMMCELMKGLNRIGGKSSVYDDFALITIIHARLGERAFGTNPGRASVMATLRTYLDSDLEKMTAMAENLAGKLSRKHSIEASINYTEEFPATINGSRASNLVTQAISLSGAKSHKISEAFRWSEDFGHFTADTEAALFGIGAGVDHPSLHNHDYDFPDDITGTGIEMFCRIAEKTVKLA